MNGKSLLWAETATRAVDKVIHLRQSKRRHHAFRHDSCFVSLLRNRFLNISCNENPDCCEIRLVIQFSCLKTLI